ncbi:hypothetical protein T12_8402, partial [Trichinella patagoniensis]
LNSKKRFDVAISRMQLVYSIRAFVALALSLSLSVSQSVSQSFTMSFVQLCAVRSVLSNQSVYTTNSTLMLLRLDWKNKRNKFSPSADISTHIYICIYICILKND